jgi:hypothetical protein
MREIEFRGKRKNGDGWAYGQYVKDFISGLPYITNRQVDSSQIHPETLGQYTGYCEKRNGRDLLDKKIFEGDILRYGKFDGEPEPDINIAVVEWYSGAFMIEGDILLDVIGIEWDVEVVGNIHDTPELLRKNEY